jgi:hypothetical protein
MTATEAGKAARRRNSAKSTGPRTPEGKAVARLNALRHGIYSAMVLIPGEADAELVALGKRLRADLAPVGELELMLADKIVAAVWRLRRLAGIEAKLYEEQISKPGQSPVRAFAGFTGDQMLRLSRHEASLERALYRALHELQRLQEARRSEEAEPAHLIDVTLATGSDGETVTPSAEPASFRQNGPSPREGPNCSILDTKCR